LLCFPPRSDVPQARYFQKQLSSGFGKDGPAVPQSVPPLYHPEPLRREGSWFF
jgi:hypothetical protein